VARRKPGRTLCSLFVLIMGWGQKASDIWFSTGRSAAVRNPTSPYPALAIEISGAYSSRLT
jgi:hypothetical protein